MCVCMCASDCVNCVWMYECVKSQHKRIVYVHCLTAFHSQTENFLTKGIYSIYIEIYSCIRRVNEAVQSEGRSYISFIAFLCCRWMPFVIRAEPSWDEKCCVRDDWASLLLWRTNIGSSLELTQEIWTSDETTKEQNIEEKQYTATQQHKIKRKKKKKIIIIHQRRHKTTYTRHSVQLSALSHIHIRSRQCISLTLSKCFI